MDRINRYLSHPLFRSHAERRSEGLFILNENVSTYWLNSVGMTDCRNGIHPVVNNDGRKHQIPSRTARILSDFTSKILQRFKSIFGSSLTGFVPFCTNHPGLKSGAIFGRPCRDFSFFITFSRPDRLPGLRFVVRTRRYFES